MSPRQIGYAAWSACDGDCRSYDTLSTPRHVPDGNGRQISIGLFGTRLERKEPSRRMMPQRGDLAMSAPNLTKLANTFGTDKGDEVADAHGYTSIYSFLFEEFRHEPFTMVEIGLQHGSLDPDALPTRKVNDIPSIKMWLEFFPKADIIGCDIADFSTFKMDRFRFERLDMGDAAALERLASSLPPVKIIIDDASHAAYHQQLALAKLFPIVQPGGFYFIEDLHVSHPVAARLPSCNPTEAVVEKFKQTRQLDIPFLPGIERRNLETSIRKMFIHRNDRGYVTSWTMKMVGFEKY
ncbi:hypothetical protein [Bradyrhizobium cenepequi]|uniref:hypothetical protein n=1 Tax=Bradyrhizobium cenepequi TaxID=2821403 RepID=UPI001CE36812|nr:hypothetical protein [Bradyrhizobium cenepequi]MCA6111560.1 hypothetical protein [Bradyrhizobium cenepequi]